MNSERMTSPPSLKKNVYLPSCFPIQTGMITFRRSTFESGFWKRKPHTLKKTIFLPSKCNFKFQRQDLGQWFGSFFILPKLGHPSLIVQSRGIRKMSGNKNPARKKVGIHSAQSCTPLNSADFSRIRTLVTKDRIWSTDFIIIEEEIFLTIKWKNIIYDSDSGWQAEQEMETYLLVALNTKICNEGRLGAPTHDREALSSKMTFQLLEHSKHMDVLSDRVCKWSLLRHGDKMRCGELTGQMTFFMCQFLLSSQIISVQGRSQEDYFSPHT